VTNRNRREVRSEGDAVAVRLAPSDLLDERTGGAYNRCSRSRKPRQVLEMADWLLGVLMRRPARPSMHSKARPTRPHETASRIELPEGAAVSNQTQLGRRTDPNPLAGSPL